MLLKKYDVPPPQGLSLGTAGHGGFNIFVPKTAAGASLRGRVLSYKVHEAITSTI